MRKGAKGRVKLSCQRRDTRGSQLTMGGRLYSEKKEGFVVETTSPRRSLQEETRSETIYRNKKK